MERRTHAIQRGGYFSNRPHIGRQVEERESGISRHTSAFKLKNAKAASHATHRPSSWRTRKRHLTPHIGHQVEERESGTSRQASAIKLKNAKATPHDVDTSASEHKDDDDDAADDDIGLAASQAATKVEKQVATMTLWMSGPLKSILEVTRDLLEREVISTSNTISHSSFFSRRNRQLRFWGLEQAQRVSEDVLLAMICTEKNTDTQSNEPAQSNDHFFSRLQTAGSVSRLETNTKFEQRSPLGNQPEKAET